METRPDLLALLDKMLWLLTAWLLIFHLAVFTITLFLTRSTSWFQMSSKSWGETCLNGPIHSPNLLPRALFLFKSVQTSSCWRCHFEINKNHTGLLHVIWCISCSPFLTFTHSCYETVYVFSLVLNFSCWSPPTPGTMEEFPKDQ